MIKNVKIPLGIQASRFPGKRNESEKRQAVVLDVSRGIFEGSPDFS